MKFLQPGTSMLVHAYKHNGSIYRAWDRAVVLEHNEDYLVLVNEEVIVTEVNGRKWKTSEPAIWFFSSKNWCNVICMLKKTGISYYTNIASPFIIEEGVVKYIDYDLDLKVYADNSYRILDLKEFNRNAAVWKYPQAIIDHVWSEVENLKAVIRHRRLCFNHRIVMEYWTRYKTQVRNK